MGKLKEPLFYTLTTSWGGGRGYRVMAVTTEKRTQYFGRYVDHDESTHRATHQCRGRFPTAESAESCIKGVIDIRDKHEDLIKATRTKLHSLERMRDKEVDDFIKEHGGTT